MADNIIEWFKGYIYLEVRNVDISRFLNVCGARQIVFFGVICTKDGATIKLSAKDYFKVYEVAKKCNAKIKIKKKIGFPFLVNIYKKRKMCIAGIISSFILMFTLSLFVWKITVEGNYTYSDEEILDFLYEHGITHGMYVKNVDGEKLEREIRNEYFDITWVSVELTGTKMTIHIKENFNIEKSSSKAQTDIVASEDGIIESIVTRSGTALVKKGDVVKKGDILIKGEYNIVDDSGTVIDTKRVSADGTIYEMVVYDYYDEISKTAENKKYVNSKDTYKLLIFNKCIDIKLSSGKSENTDVVSSEKQLRLTDNFYLPVYVYTYTEKKYTYEEREYSKEECIEQLNENFKYFLEKIDEKSIQIVENNVRIEDIGNNYIARGDIVILKQIH